MYPETPIDYASSKIISGEKTFKKGSIQMSLHIGISGLRIGQIEIVPRHLKDKIHFEQDRILWMKLKLDVSKRAVPYVMQIIQGTYQ